MSTSSFAAAALLIEDDCLAAGAAAAAAAAALHGGFESLLFVTGEICFVCATRHGDARGRSDLLEDVVEVDDVVHAVVDVVLAAAADVVLVVDVGLVVEAPVLSVVVVVTVQGMVVSLGGEDE